jgi:hypothetical protein
MSRLVRSIRVLLPLLTIALAGALTSCGDDSTPQGPDGSTSGLSGHFVDSYVQGLSYASGSTTGSTGANGKFFFEKDTDVSFAVGDIALGTGTPAAIMSPLQLVLGAVGVTNPTVTNLCRFLQTIDNDANPANGIVITSAVVAAAAGQSINFEQDTGSFGSDPNVQSVVSALTTATAAGERALVGVAEAQAQLTSGLREAYVGSNSDYNGDFCVDQQSGQTNGGTWAMEVAADGSVSIGFDGTPTFTATGTMDLLGNVTATALGGVEVYGAFDPDFVGRWYAGEASGSFSESADCSH